MTASAVIWRCSVLCCRFTVGYYSYQVWQAQELCPRPQPAAAGSFAATATTEASRVWSAQNAIVKLPRTAPAQVLAAPALPGCSSRLRLDSATTSAGGRPPQPTRRDPSCQQSP